MAKVTLPTDEQILNTEVFEVPDEPQDEAGAALVTVTFTEVAGHTTLTQLVQTSSKELRDLIMDSGMETGLQEQLDLLEELAISLR